MKRILETIGLMLCIILVVAVCITSLSAQEISKDLLARYKAVLPKVDEPLVQEVFDSPRTIWYNTESMGVWYQAWDREALQGTFSAFRNVDATRPPDPFGNGNREYPWAPTLGGGSFNTDVAKVHTLKGLLLPEQDGQQLPIIMLRQQQPRKWSFPTLTRIVEIAWTEDSRGKWYPFETRFRMREPDDWRTERLLPYGTRDKLVAAVAETHPGIAALIPKGKRTKVRIQDRHPRQAINSDAIVQVLPNFPEELTRRLLKTGVQAPMAGTNYADDCDGATTKQAFHVRPAGDLTQNHGNGEREQCRQCHRDIDKHVRANFESNRGWYGDIRGSDGIFSFFPHRTFVTRNIVVPRHQLPRDWRSNYEWSKFLVDELTDPLR